MNVNYKIKENQLIKSGIYSIKNIITGKLYVGSTVKFQERWTRHLSDLNNKKHANKHLQNSFNKHGEFVFTFHILEEVEFNSNLIEREQHWIDFLNPDYNMCKQAGRPPVVEWTDEMRIKHKETMRNRVLSAESKQRMVDALTRGRISYFARPKEERLEHGRKIGDALRGRKLSEAHRIKCGLARLGTTLTEEHKQTIRLANSNSYIIVSPTLERYEVNDGLFTFAKQHSLNESALAHVARGDYKHHKGWQCFLAENFTEDNVQDSSTFKLKGETVYIVTRPDGEEESTTNLYEYARQYNLDGSALRKVATGKLPQYKKYRIREEGVAIAPLPKRKKSTFSQDNTHHFICTTPDGTEYTTTNMPSFALEHSICKESMRSVAKGRLRQYKGWLCRYTPETLAKLTVEQQVEVQTNFNHQTKYPDRKPISAEDKQRIIDASRTPEVLAKRSALRKGWKPDSEQLNNLSLGHCKRTFIITTPTGEQIITKQLVQFAKDLNMKHSGFYKACKTGNPHKGYTVREEISG